MNDFVNATTCSGEEQKRETARELLDDMGGILKEMENQVAMISDAVYRGKSLAEESINEPCAPPPMVVMMQGQRDTAEYLLKEIIRIREALW